jgi:hypothetical protein
MVGDRGADNVKRPQIQDRYKTQLPLLRRSSVRLVTFAYRMLKRRKASVEL